MATSYESVLESMKFPDAKTLLQSANFVSTEWARAASSHELWSSIISNDAEEEIVVEASRFSTGRLAFKLYWEMKNSLFAFDDHDRFKDDERREDAEKRGEKFIRQPTDLIIVSLPSKSKRVIKLPASYDHCFHSSAVWLPPADLFITGGRFEDREDTIMSPTYLVSLNDAKFESLEQVPQINSPGLVLYRKVIYSFGGSIFPKEKAAVSLKTARKFPLKARKWFPLGDEKGMPNAHCYGYIERYNTKIFIIGGFGSNGAIDEFDTLSETFRVLPLELSTRSEAVFGIRKKEAQTILLLSGQKVIEVDLHELQTNSSVRAIESNLQQDNVWMWNLAPVICEKAAHFILFDLMLFSFDLEKKTFEQQLIKDA